MSNNLWPHGLQHSKLPCPSLSPRVCSNSRPLSQWCYLTISSPAALFSFCLQSFPASGSFPMSWLCIKWPNYWSFNFCISPSIEYSVLIFFRIDWFDFLAVQGTLESPLPHHNSKASILQCSASNSHICTWLWEKQALIIWTIVKSTLDSILKSRDITLPTKVHTVKAMVFPVVLYRHESWIIKKAEHQRTDAFELWCWRRLLKVPWTVVRRSDQSILKEINPEYSLDELMLKLKLQCSGHLMQSQLIGKDPDSGED